jgi:hypothetical protein
MEMSYNYEWTFCNFVIPDSADSNIETENDSTTSQEIRVMNSLRPLYPLSNSKERPELQFTARMQVDRFSMHPFRIAYYFSIFPMYCMIVQIWIHIQAFYLFTKGVAYQPHPTGAETWASRIIGTAMVPLFALQDKYRKLTNTNHQMNESTIQLQKQKVS